MKILRGVASALILAACVAYVTYNRDEFAILLTVQWPVLAVLVVALALNSLADAARFAVLYRGLGAEITIPESFGLSQVSVALNQVLPGGLGGAARMVYVKNRYGTPYSYTPAVLLCSAVVSLGVGSVVMLVTNATIALSGGAVPPVLWLVAVGGVLSVACLWLSVPESLIGRLGPSGKAVVLMVEGWRRIRTNRRCLALATVYQVVSFGTGGLEIAIGYRTLGLELDPLLGVSIAVFIAFSNIVLVTPGNLGVQEAVVGYLSLLSGMMFVHGVVVSALIRAANTGMTFTLAPVAWYLLFWRRKLPWRSVEGLRQEPLSQQTPSATSGLSRRRTHDQTTGRDHA